jgi:hypothetical protein
MGAKMVVEVPMWALVAGGVFVMSLVGFGVMICCAREGDDDDQT